LSERLRKQWRWVVVAVAVLALAIVSKQGDGDVGPLGGPDQCRVEVIADTLNVRAGPSPDSETVDELNRGAIVNALPETTNGFRKLGENRWVSLDFVTSHGRCG
jgi:uncharacterized protein YgiM (DUF1202 family)